MVSTRFQNLCLIGESFEQTIYARVSSYEFVNLTRIVCSSAEIQITSVRYRRKCHLKVRKVINYEIY